MKLGPGPESTPVFVFKVGLTHPAMGPFAGHNIAQWLTRLVVHYVEHRVLASLEPFL